MTRKARLFPLWTAVVAIMFLAADAKAGQVAWWPAEGNANDSVGGAHGLLEAVSFAPGKVGSGFRFTGGNSSVRVPDTGSLDLTSHWTLAAWVYTTSLSGHKGGAQGVISKVGGGGGNYGYQFGIADGTGEVLLLFNESGQVWPGHSLKGGRVHRNTWTFVAGTYDNNTMAIYVNGALVASRIVGPRRVANSSSSFRIGLDDNGNVDFSGMIDEVRVYNHALSDDEIRSLSSAADVDQNPATRTFSHWTSITPDLRQSIAQPGRTTPLAVIGHPTFEAGRYMVYVGASNPAGQALSRWNTYGPFTLNGHDKVYATMKADSRLTMETNPAELLQYSDPGPAHAMIYARNDDRSSWQSICVLPVGWDAEARCFGGTNNVIYIPDTDSNDQLNGQLAWWRAEGNAKDSVGGANGFLEGVSFGPGKIGSAFQFNGSKSSVRVPDTGGLDLTSHWTLTAWVYTTSLSGHKGGAQGVVSKVGGPGGNYGYQFGIVDGAGDVLLQFNQSGQGWPGQVLRAGKVPLNTWTFIAGSFDNDTMAIYVNGVLAGSKSVGAKRAANSSSSLRIGLDDNGNVDFSGMIDEVRVYNFALSAGELRRVMDSSRSNRTGD